MKPFIRKNCWLLIASLILILPNFFPYQFFKLSQQKLNWETYQPVLASKLRSVSDVIEFTDSLTLTQNIKPGTLQYGVILNRVIKWRFYHGYSYYSMSENWLAAIFGRLFWKDLSAIVLPNDILKYPMAACSQQSIVLMECLHRKGIPYRKVGFDHHYVVEANLDGGWYYFDPDMEPDFSHAPRGSLDFLIKNDLFPVIYKKSLDSLQLKATLDHPYRGKINASPAPNASVFHKVTKVGSRTLWLLPLSLYLLMYIKRKRKLSEQLEEYQSKSERKKKVAEFA